MDLGINNFYDFLLLSGYKFMLNVKQVQTGGSWIIDYVVDIEVHAFFIKAFCRNIELRVKLSYVFHSVPYGI